MQTIESSIDTLLQTLADLGEKDLINYDLLTVSEKNYLFKYHFEVYSKISKFLNQNEKNWLASFI